MSGVDLLIKNIMSAAGIDAEKVKTEIQEYGRQLAAKIESMDKALADLKAQQELTYELLVNISLKLRNSGLSLPASGVAPSAAEPNGRMPRA